MRHLGSVDPDIKTIFVSNGFASYVGGTVIELTGEDISGDGFMVGLSSVPSPVVTEWVDPDVSEAGNDTNQWTLKLLIDNSFALGVFWAWGKVTDSPEIEPVLLEGPFRIV